MNPRESSAADSEADAQRGSSSAETEATPESSDASRPVSPEPRFSILRLILDGVLLGVLIYVVSILFYLYA